MESFTKISWAILALIHVSPALSALKPKLIERLYGIAPQGDMGVLMTHRGFLFLAMFATCIIAICLDNFIDQRAEFSLSLHKSRLALGPSAKNRHCGCRWSTPPRFCNLAELEIAETEI